MAIKWLDAKRLQGTNAERLALTTVTKCATFNGTNAVITGLGDLFSGTGAYSASVWLYHTGGTSGNDGVCSPDGGQEFLFFKGSNQYMYCTSPTQLQSSTTVAEDTWFHVCVTRDGSSNVKFYINAGTPTTTTASGSIESDSWRFGYAHSTEFWGGSAIEFATWSGRELSATEVSAIYNSGSPAKLSNTTLDDTGTDYTEDLTGYYPMDTDFDKFAGVGGNNGSNANATVGNSSPATPIPSVYPSLSNGTIFNETDTYKYFMFDGTDTWNQMVSS